MKRTIRGQVMKFRVIAATLCMLAIGVSCGGSGGGEGGGAIGGGPGGSTLFSGTFSGDQNSPAAGMITTSQGGTSSNLVTVGISLTGVDDVFGASFDVTYDPTAVSYVSFSPGTILERGGDSPVYLVSTQSGLVRVGISRSSGSAGGVDVVAPETLINLTFSMNRAGASQLGFQDGRIQDAQSPPQTIPGLNWFGGQFQAN